MPIIIGMRLFSWGSALTPEAMRCGQCGMVAPFLIKQGMRFITVFFIIPVIPISGIQHLLQCPSCGARFKANV